MKALQQRKFLVAFMILLVAGLFILVYWNNPLFAAQPCVPIGYSDSKQLDLHYGVVNVQQAQDPIGDVLQLYDKQLGARVLISISEDWNQDEWVRVQIGNGEYMYQCLTSAMSGLFTYEGCIYIREASTDILIESILYRFEEAAFDCNDPILTE